MLIKQTKYVNKLKSSESEVTNIERVPAVAGQKEEVRPWPGGGESRLLLG